MVSPVRALAAAVFCSLLLVAGAFVVELSRFGWNDDAAIGRLEQDVRRVVAERAQDVERLAGRVVAETPLIVAAARDRERVPELFDRLNALSSPVDEHDIAATIYAPTAIGEYAPLAWGSGPGDKNLEPERLAGPAAVFTAPGHAGLRLITTHPIEASGQRLAVVVTETVIAPNDRPTISPERQIMTAFGPVPVIEQYASSRDDLPMANGFVVNAPDGAPLLEVQTDPTELANRRRAFRARHLALAILPLVLVTALLVPRFLGSRGNTRRLAWVVRACSACGLILCSAGLLWTAARFAGAATDALAGIGAAALLGLVVVLAGSWWSQPRRRTRPRVSPVRFTIEQLLAGAVIAVGIEVAARTLALWITPDSLMRWRFVLFPFDRSALISLGTLLLLELALVWGLALVVATIVGRWRLRSAAAVVIALALMGLPAAVVLASPSSAAHGVAPGGWTILACALVFVPLASWMRRYYRRTTQSMRLVLGLCALAGPLIASYPLGAMTADRATRVLIERDYAPATADHLRELRAELDLTQTEIDQFATLADLVSLPPSNDTLPAFLVWQSTSLSKTRVISDVELYGADGSLVSRFAFNLPEYIYRTTEPWRATSCDWEVFGEVAPFGAEARRMLHAMRGVCDQGRIRGGIVVHVASDDYQALRFLASANPYMALIGGADAAAAAAIPDLQVAVFGWSYQPIFTSGRVAWPIPREVFDRLYNPAVPFWRAITTDERTYQIHFSQNRNGIYALGYPTATWFEHAARLAEIVALSGVFFVLIQLAAVLSAPLARRARAPLGQLFHEIRTSFYRKLFLFFVAVAIVPVLIFAVAFGSYMTSRFRADVEAEARATVSVARRVFEELAAADSRPDTPAAPTNDDVMVWIRQVIGQDVNLFGGPELVATSQRDLFDSGLLPTRTPADVYRDIVLQRLPMTVVEDRVGEFGYLVAAAPVPVSGREAILTVPLAPRQREIEREGDELNRGVLVGSVLVVLLAAGLGASLASRIADPVARLTRATRQIAAGDLDVRITADTADELRRLVDDFNSMAETLVAQRKALARTNQLKAWNEMARQVAHEIKNPLTPIQLAAEHLQHVHEDRGRPLGTVVDQCLRAILGQVRLLRQIASEFSNFAGEPTPRPERVEVGSVLASIVDPYRIGLGARVRFALDIPKDLPPVWADRTLLSRALTNLVENAIQAMPGGGTLTVTATIADGRMALRFEDTGVGMDANALERAFEPFFSTKTGGSGLGLANARRNIEIGHGTIAMASTPGAGTVVTVSLPLAIPRDGTGSASSPSR